MRTFLVCVAAMHVNGQHTTCAVANEGSEIVFDCGGDLISAVSFGSFGTPRGTCESGDSFQKSDCHVKETEVLLEERCLGMATCIFQVTAESLGGAPKCGPGTSKRWLAAVLTCGSTPSAEAPTAAGNGEITHLGWTVVFLLGLIFSLYCGLGIAYNVRRNGAKIDTAQGLAEALPHLEMWKDLPILVRDGFVFAVDTIKSKATSQYETMGDGKL